MNTRLMALQLMAVQGCLGAFDTLYHHELTEALPSRPGARRELAIHAIRAVIYGVLFIGLSCWEWQGAWAAVLLALFGVEIALTLWDFVEEDRTRLLPATERVTHTVLAMNGGAFVCLLALNAPAWLQAETGFAYAPHGWLSVFLVLCGAGVTVSGIRDAFAARVAQARPAPVRFAGAPQTVLVTGATGFIGRALVPLLLASGHRVIVLTREPKKVAWESNGAVRSVASMDALPASERIDVIINLAGARILGWRWSAARKAVLRGSRVGLTQQLVAWIARADTKPRLLLSASAIGYYGVQDQGSTQALNEACPPQAIFMSQLCQEWEAAAQRAREYGVPVACTRFGVVFGKGGGALPSMLLPLRLGFGGPMGTGRQRQSWIHLDDLLAALAHVWQMNGGADGAWNFTAPEAPTQREFAQTAAALLHRPCFMPTPAWPVRLLLGEQADLLLEGQDVAPARLLSSGFSFRHPGLRAALQDLLLAR